MSRAIKRAESHTTEQINQAAAEFKKLHAELKAVAEKDHEQPNVDLQDAAMAALGILSRHDTPDIQKRFSAMEKSGEFSAKCFQRTRALAWAAIHIRRNYVLQANVKSTTKITPATHEEGTALRTKMRKVAEYYLSDNPKVHTILEYLAEGSGYLDLANDLMGYAELYEQHHDTLHQDKRLYQASDKQEALRIAHSIYKQLGVSGNDQEDDWLALQGAIWPLLRKEYEEVKRAGTFLFHYDHAEERFPSLITAARSSSKQSSTNTTEPVKPT